MQMGKGVLDRWERMELERTGPRTGPQRPQVANKRPGGRLRIPLRLERDPGELPHPGQEPGRRTTTKENARGPRHPPALRSPRREDHHHLVVPRKRLSGAYPGAHGDGPGSVRRAEGTHRAPPAVRAPRGTHESPELHHRLVESSGVCRIHQRPERSIQRLKRRVRSVEKAREDPSYIPIHSGNRDPMRNARHGACGVGTDPRERAQLGEGFRNASPVALHHDLSRPMEIAGPRVVAQPLPEAEEFIFRRARQRLRVWEPGEPPPVVGHHGVYPRLLKHDLRDEDGPRIPRLPPWECPAPKAEKVAEGIPNPLTLSGGPGEFEAVHPPNYTLPPGGSMAFRTYTKFRGGFLDALNLEALLEHLSDFLLDGGFAGGPHHHPWWGWSGTEDTKSMDALKDALLRALLETGQLTPEMIRELRGEGEGDAELQARIAELLDDLVARLLDEGFLTADGGEAAPGGSPPPGEPPPEGTLQEARKAAEGVEFSVTRKGMDFLGYRALRGLLGAMGHSTSGSHETPRLSTGVEAGAGSRPYAFGDTSNLDIPATLARALARAAASGADPLPLLLEYEDLMVNQTEFRSSAATVLMLDVSHSMILYGEDRFSPAKRVALALSHLIRTQYPGDTLRVVTFGDRAEEIPLSRLGRAQVGPFHTNTAEGLKIARRILLSQPKEMRQIIMVTDGKPSAMTLPDGRVYVNSGGLDPAILKATYAEVAACRTAGILINTFMLARDPYLVEFVRKVSEISRGKAYFANTLTLGQSVMMDFMKGKRRRAG
jgi:Ca-activated chloride channel homolog